MRKMIARVRAWARGDSDARLDELPLVLGFGIVSFLASASSRTGTGCGTENLQRRM